MKINMPKTEFKPFTIEVETIEEAKLLLSVLGAMTTELVNCFDVKREVINSVYHSLVDNVPNIDTDRKFLKTIEVMS